MPYLFVFIFLVTLSTACTIGPASTSLYKAKGGKHNTPYDNSKANNKELKEHQRQAQKRQKEIDAIEHKDRDPSHGAKDVGAAKEEKK